MEKITYNAPDGHQTDSFSIGDMLNSCRLNRMLRGYCPLLHAIGICFENPDYLKKKGGLYQVVTERMSEHNSLAVTPKQVKANMRTAINYMWKKRLQIHDGRSSTYPFTMTHFIKKAVQALNDTNSSLKRTKILWGDEEKK